MHWVHTMAQAKEKEKKVFNNQKTGLHFCRPKIKRWWIYQHTNIYGTPNQLKKD